MKKRLFAIFSFLCYCLQAQHPSTDSRWHLKTNVSDEFNGSTVNTSKWTVRNWLNILQDTSTCSLPAITQAYTLPLPNNNVAIIDTGILTLAVKYDPILGKYNCIKADTNYEIYYPVDFTSGELYSNFSTKYGYFEIKFMMPSDTISDGKNYNPFGPNFWLFGQTDTIRREIDIFENNHHSGAIRYTNSADYPNYTNNLDSLIISGITTGEWHTAACNWTPNKLEFYLDGNLVRTANESWINDMGSMRIIIDINAPSAPHGLTFYPLDTATAQLPYIYYIDYVRVWQLQQDCATDIAFCNTAPTVLNDDDTYQSITLGASGCNLTFIDYVSLKGTDFIILDENSVIPSPTTGNSQILEVEGCMTY